MSIEFVKLVQDSAMMRLNLSDKLLKKIVQVRRIKIILQCIKHSIKQSMNWISLSLTEMQWYRKWNLQVWKCNGPRWIVELGK